jgi:hypothetical protein
MNNPTQHPLNEGRESLFELEVGKLYIIEGDASGQFSTMKEHVSRYALSNVLVKEYNLETQYAQLPVVAFATHVNAIRKSQGMEHVDFTDGKRQYFIAQLVEYETKGVERRAFRIFRDSKLHKEIYNIEKRIRGLSSTMLSRPSEEIQQRLNRNHILLEKLSVQVETYRFVPWVTKTNLLSRIERCQKELNTLEESFRCVPVFL